MLYIVIYGIAICVISVVLYLLVFISYKRNGDKETGRPFECGLDPKGSTRLMFCIKFFLVGVIFLIFDVEVSLILPIPFSSTLIILLVIVLILGLAYEWFYGGLDWLT